MDEYGEYANLPVFNAHGDIVGYVGGEVPESGNPCEFNRLGDEGFTYCASATEVVMLKAENDRLRELVLAAWKCIHSGVTCSGCRTIAGGCTLQTAMHDLGIEVDR